MCKNCEKYDFMKNNDVENDDTFKNYEDLNATNND